jgi:predicted Zn-dependent protease
VEGPARALIAVPALLALAWLATIAERLGSTDAVVYDAGKEISTWTASGAAPGRETVSWVREDLQLAVTRDPNNPSLHEMLGRLALFTRGDAATDEAIAHLTQAIEQRPSSPYSWGSLVEALYRKGDTGPRFEQALRRAAETGPWEPEVQRTVADYGFAVWNDVSASTRAAIDHMVANGIVRNAPEILQISLRRGRLGVACAHLGLSTRIDPKWTRICHSTEAT